MKMSKLWIVLITCALISNCYAHEGHSHHDQPAFKYSREANEEFHHSDHHHHHEETVHNIKKPQLNDVWFDAICSTLIISAAPILMLYVVPIDNTIEKQALLKVLLAFASGGLLGDAFLHLIPHATIANQEEEGHSHSHSHSHHSDEPHGHDMTVGLGVLCGIVAFLMIEKAVRILKGGEAVHSHSHSHAKVPRKLSETGTKSSSSSITSSEEEKTSGKQKKKVKKSKVNDQQQVEEKKEIKVAGFLNLAADFSHNFTDGLAIGASYLAGRNIGIVTTVTILFHEVPHELGDFAILLQSGVSRKSAILLQLSTAIGALAGTCISLLAQDGSLGFLASKWILPFTAGGFIYISLVSVIPELLNEEKPSVLQTFFQILALLVGVYMMVLIAAYE